MNHVQISRHYANLLNTNKEKSYKYAHYKTKPESKEEKSARKRNYLLKGWQK